MTSELPPVGVGPEYAESEPVPLGVQLQTELTALQYVIGNDIRTYMPEQAAAYSERFKHRHDSAPTPSDMPYDELKKVQEMYVQLRTLFAQKLGYTTSLDENSGLYGFYCTRLSPNALRLRKVIADKQVDIVLAPDGPDIKQEISVEDTRFIDHYRDWQSGKITAEELDKRIELIKLEQNMTENPFPSLTDVLHEHTEDFLVRVIDRARQTREWFADCRATGIDPFDRSLWE